MAGNRNQEIFGIFLALLGLLFLLVNNKLLWFGWEVLWPAIPFLLGLFLLRLFAANGFLDFIQLSYELNPFGRLAHLRWILPA